MKLNPYPVLLTTGALMFATVMFAQTGASVGLLQAGAASLDRDVSGPASKALSPRPFSPASQQASHAMLVSKDRAPGTRLAFTDGQPDGLSKD